MSRSSESSDNYYLEQSAHLLVKTSEHVHHALAYNMRWFKKFIRFLDEINNISIMLSRKHIKTQILG